jgi:aminomethyltransferase
MALGILLKDGGVDKPDGVVKPAGLGARDTLRMEAGMPLYGHELGEEINALSCGVDFAIALEKDQAERGEPFVGQEALKRVKAEGGPARVLAGIALEGKRTARQGMVVKDERDAEVGVVTSACLSPTLGTPIAMALVNRGAAEIGTRVRVETGRETVLEGAVRKLPFHNPTRKG